MVRLYGRSQGGSRCVDHQPYGHWISSTFIAALRHDRLEAPMLLNGPMNADCFLGYVRQFLVPTLKRDDIVICDNLSSHKSAEVEQAIRAVGARIHYLPPYSPDLNPIEMLFSRLKGFLRQRATRTLADLTEALVQALSAISPSYCSHLFRHAQYDAT